MTNFKGTKEEILKECEKELFSDILSFIKECRKQKNRESNLIAILHMVQEEYGYLAEKKIEAVSYLMDIPLAKITGVATFYHFFKLKPRGKYIISVCIGTACHVKGADLIAKKLKEELGIGFSETTKDNLFTLESARCLGMCALAPVIKIEEDIYSKVTADQIPKILESYYNKEKKKKE